ncbi:hypothetical protein [Kangiella sp.]|uniref:hypothetical protein n=1 Tax=Kangiella sp. TaxID=1920245 RepID=UPI003A9456E6
MYDDIQNPPQQLPQSKFKPWFWLLLLPIYLLGCLWALKGSVSGWRDLLALTNLPIFSLMVVMFAITTLLWTCYKLVKGFNKLTECSRYEVYLAEVFENRDRQRPAQNAMRLDYLRKLRKRNSEVRVKTEIRQRQLLALAIFGLLILLIGTIGQLTSQFLLP